MARGMGEENVLPVQDADLGGPLDPARQGLVDFDVLNGRIIFVVVDAEGDGGEADGLAREPANVLEREDVVGGIGEGLVLHRGELVYRRRGVTVGKRARTIVQVPVRLSVVISAGAAIFAVVWMRMWRVYIRVGYMRWRCSLLTGGRGRVFMGKLSTITSQPGELFRQCAGAFGLGECAGLMMSGEREARVD